MKAAPLQPQSLSPQISVKKSPEPFSGNQIFKSFSEMLSDRQLQGLLQKGLAGKSVNPGELIQAQVLIGRYQLKTELITKCAEGINATLRRIQQGT